ncbi:MAG: hypothetical protein KKE30_03045 [Gammaproteobacteria bacterium]|nr:hypothetical protein [Gammaproteobacteria bacterium]MBU1556269.1 hypothetical protein [Gammaproteobacteria bacterium]MBU2071491.1 hypothetical protein [Gammaproteobacteria bacterium]MBU2181517.1 hypothetical protein [Gammaproteobacteria bacterium]MBU2203743.1 hypothetical protein [Gammaproteobacteria bacterium]
MTIANEIKVLRVATIASLALSAVILTTGMKAERQGHFDTLTVERLNIVEADGTVKMLLTNTARFPTTEEVNGTVLNEGRKKRSGMLFFNEEGIEAGGFIYDGSKNERGHSAGMSLTFDKYDGDQVMQLLTTDEKRGDKRIIRSGLAFNDRAEFETQSRTREIMRELNQITDKAERNKKASEYEQQGLIGGAPRILLGKTAAQNNGLFLFAKDGSPRAMFFVDEHDEVQLQFMNSKGEVTHTWSGGDTK